jgi:ferredoxin
MVAKELAVALAAEECRVHLHNLDLSVKQEALPEAEPDIRVVLFALHAFDAPEPVWKWFETLPSGSSPVAVLSVSAGGEMYPNTGCRGKLCRAFEAKGYRVFYDRMLVMPANWVFSITDEMAMHLIRVLPQKARTIAGQIAALKERRAPKQKLGPVRALLPGAEKAQAPGFAKKFRILETCTSCGLCARICPTLNVAMVEGRPVFAEQCVMCFRCIYRCPSKAIFTKDFQVLKGGFDLKALQKRMEGKELPPWQDMVKGLMWLGVRRYLEEED